MRLFSVLLALAFSLCALVVTACDNTTRPDYVVHLVNESGQRPFDTACTSGAIRIDVAQGTNAVLTTNGTLTGGMPGALSVQIPSYGLLTQIQVIATCTAGNETQLIGSTPQFVPVGYGFVNIVMAPPDTCVPLTAPVLVPPVIAPSMVRLDANVVSMGGVDGSGMPSTGLQLLDTVQLTHVSEPQQLAALSAPAGRGRALRLSPTGTQILFVTTPSTGIYDAAPNVTTRVTPIDGLHTGANAESAVVDLVGNGIAIVGGATGDSAVTHITWVSPTGVVTHGELVVARRQPAAAYVRGKLLVAGGQEPGAPLFEIVSVGSTEPGATFEDTLTEQRFAPVLTTNLDHTRAFLLLGSADPDDATMQRTTTYSLSGCMSAPTPGCTVTVGPDFPDAPRSGVAVIEHHVGGAMGVDDYETLLIGGLDVTTSSVSPLVDRVHFDGTQFTIAPAGMLLASRTSAGATEIGGGVVLVAGGAGDRGNALGTAELCFPRALAPISSLQ